MIEWLEVKTNFNLLVGAATTSMKTGTVAGAKLTKKSAYEGLADFVNQKCGLKWDWRNAEARVRGYIKRFRSTKRAQLNPGGAKYNIGEEDKKKGIFSIEAKLNADCPNFARMDVLFGSRQNITPAFTLTPGMRPKANIVVEALADLEEWSDDEGDYEEEQAVLTNRVEEGEDESQEQVLESQEQVFESEEQVLESDEAAEALASLASSVIRSPDTSSLSSTSTQPQASA
jgi:hypothetical protein